MALFERLFRAFFSSRGHPIYVLWLYLVNDVGGIICRDYNGSLMAGCCSESPLFWGSIIQLLNGG